MSESFTPPVGCNSRVIYQSGGATPAAEREQRLMRLYTSEGGALSAWLTEESQRRGHTKRRLAEELGISVPYTYLLRTRPGYARGLSSKVVAACARYLGVPPIVVKVLAGAVPMSDFLWPEQSEEQVIDRAMESMTQDPIARVLLPADLKSLPLDVRRSLVLLYAESSSQDVLGVRQLPDVLQHLQAAVAVHDNNVARAAA